jgi:SAM-dependent methyltransferase
MMQTPQWLNTLTGRNLLREEVRQVRRALDGIFGDQFVQIACWGEPGLFRRLARTHRAAVLADRTLPGVDIVSAVDALAIASDSVDAVFLPHTLETAADPHGLLREVDRILRPDGNLVVLGFNPWGWWGARHAVSRDGFPPGAQRLISEGRLHDWLRLLDFKVHHSAFYYFVPPVLRGAAPRHGRIVRADDAPRKSAGAPESPGRTGGRPARAGRGAEGRLARALRVLRRGPAFAGCYILVARKQTYVVTPIRLAWRRRTALVGGLVNPTTRTAA